MLVVGGFGVGHLQAVELAEFIKQSIPMWRVRPSLGQDQGHRWRYSIQCESVPLMKLLLADPAVDINRID